MEILYFIGTYLIGFFITLTFLKFTGKKIGIDYDDASLYDDYHSNAEAYTIFSFFWFISVPFGLILGLIALIEKFADWYMKMIDKFLKL